MMVPMLPTRFLDRAVELYAGKIGVVDGEKRFTYAQYFERVNRLSHGLAGLGIKPGDRVAFLAYNSHELLEAYYGVVQMGAILLPLNIRLTAEDFVFILNDAGARVLVVDPDFAPVAERLRGRVPSLEYFVLLGSEEKAGWLSYEGLLSGARAHRYPRPAMDENDVAELFYTSGTTGTPKGVMLTHRNLYANAIAYITAVGVNDSTVQLHTVPLFHVNGWGTPHALTAVGGTHVMIRKFDPRLVFELIQREKVTLAAMVPTMINALINFPDAHKYDYSSFRKVIVGGAPTPLAFVKAVSEKFGWEYITGYGLSETSPILTIANLKEHLKKLPPEERYIYQAKTGLPVIGVEIRVVNSEGRDVRRDGQEIGEIIARGDVVMKGYWNRPEETAAAIVDGWFHTGDMATIDEEGYILIMDRKKDIIISGGENIASVEIENVLYTHPAVLEVAVIAVPDPQWGEVPKALVVLKPGQSATPEELIAHCASRLARFKIPKSVEILESLPKTGTGKILKTALREKYWQGYEKRVS